jgi:hypothetical protein
MGERVETREVRADASSSSSSNPSRASLIADTQLRISSNPSATSLNWREAEHT